MEVFNILCGLVKMKIKTQNKTPVIKCLLNQIYFNIEKASDEDLNKFFNENFYMIYGVFFDSFTAYENSCKKGNSISLFF